VGFFCKKKISHSSWFSVSKFYAIGNVVSRSWPPSSSSSSNSSPSTSNVSLNNSNNNNNNQSAADFSNNTSTSMELPLDSTFTLNDDSTKIE
jgi:hypothetical protein